MTQIDEQWLDLPKERRTRGKESLVSISNTGKYRRADGTIGCLDLRHKVRYLGELERCYRIIAEHFLITVKRPDQNQIDHITHYPTEYNVNDVRNLRWCTHKENCGFEEGVNKRSKENHSNWKGDSANPITKYHRSLRCYRKNQTEENLATLEKARLVLNEYRRSIH